MLYSYRLLVPGHRHSAGKKRSRQPLGDWASGWAFLIWTSFVRSGSLADGAPGVLDDPGKVLVNGGSARDIAVLWALNTPVSGLPRALAIALLLFIGAR